MNRNSFRALACTVALLLAGAQSAHSLTVITGSVGSTGKYLLSGSAVNVTTNAVLKITFETTTAGINLALCAGTTADFGAGKCAVQLNDSGAPGFTFLVCPIHSGDAASHSRLCTTILHSESSTARGFCENLTTNLWSRPVRASMALS